MSTTMVQSAPTKPINHEATELDHTEPDATQNGKNGVVHHLDLAWLPVNPLPDLPTFSLEVGWREVYDPVTGETHQLPLTLLDILYPEDSDVGVVNMTQGPWHDILTVLITTMLRTWLGARNWLITHDVIVHWGRPHVQPKSPDIAAMFGGQLPAPETLSYRVGRDGPLPAFIIEVTSKETRQIDLEGKPILYAAVGVQELLIIDILNDATHPWQLIGYRLGNRPFYDRLTPDNEGGITFQTVGLRFVPVGRVGVDIYDIATGQRLLTPTEEAARAQAQAERAETEATARIQAEARAEAEAARSNDLEQRVRELEARLNAGQ